jgi:hypothetical protein
MFDFIENEAVNIVNKRVQKFNIKVGAQHRITFSDKFLSQLNHNPTNYIWIGKIFNNEGFILAIASIPEILDAEGNSLTKKYGKRIKNGSYVSESVATHLGSGDYELGEVIKDEDKYKVYELVSSKQLEADHTADEDIQF